MVWKPHVTVASVAERDGKFLVVEETVAGQAVINNPAGHLEQGESLAAAAVRETLEETGWDFEPEAIVGIYLWEHPQNHLTFLRTCFCGRALRHHPTRRLDYGIINARWLSREALAAESARLRGPLVLRGVDDYLAGVRYPLDAVSYLPV